MSTDALSTFSCSIFKSSYWSASIWLIAFRISPICSYILTFAVLKLAIESFISERVLDCSFFRVRKTSISSSTTGIALFTSSIRAGISFSSSFIVFFFCDMRAFSLAISSSDRLTNEIKRSLFKDGTVFALTSPTILIKTPLRFSQCSPL